jgi:hypothetical protein
VDKLKPPGVTFRKHRQVETTLHVLFEEQQNSAYSDMDKVQGTLNTKQGIIDIIKHRHLLQDQE